MAGELPVSSSSAPTLLLSVSFSLRSRSVSVARATTSTSWLASNGFSRKSDAPRLMARSEEHTSELQSLMRISYAVFCLKKKINKNKNLTTVSTLLHRQTHNEN